LQETQYEHYNTGFHPKSVVLNLLQLIQTFVCFLYLLPL